MKTKSTYSEHKRSTVPQIGIELTLEQLPKAVSNLTSAVNSIKDFLFNGSIGADKDQLLVTKEAATFLHMSVPTLYGYVSRREIPFIKRPNSKSLWFSKVDLIAWIKEGKRKTKDEISAESNSNMKLNKKQS